MALLIRLAGQPELVERAGERAREAFLAEYDRPAGTARILAILKPL
jgi:hypothetical protein